jgi:membrane protease YdiL (CAAX protease family)
LTIKTRLSELEAFIVTDPLPNRSEIEPLTRTQVLLAMGVTALLLLAIAKLWMHFGEVPLLSWHWAEITLLQGAGVGLVISTVSAAVYRLWPAYRQNADTYLELVIKPLTWPDLVWLGLLPGLSEELLFRGVMLPSLGLNWVGLMGSSLCFGVSHLSGLKQWPYALWAATVGLFLGYTALASQNLLVPILAHIITNLISGLTWKLTHPARNN